MNKTKKIFLILVVLFAAGGLSYGASNGTTALAFLEMGAGARYIGMGNAGTAITDDSTSMYWNPGLMAKSGVNSVDLMHSIYVEETFYDYASMVLQLGEKSAIGISAQYFSSGELKTFDDTGYGTGDINPYDVAVALGYGIDINGFGIGIAAKFIQSEIISSANTYAFNFGISAPALLDDSLVMGAVIANVGEGITYDKEKEELPMTIRFGAGFYILHNLLITADVGQVKDRDVYGAGGGEYILDVNSDISMSFRAGYNTISETEDLSGLTAGLGFEYKSVILDYAFVPMGNLGDTHRISLTFFW